MNKQRINHLLQKYLDGSLDDNEKVELLQLYRSISSQPAEYPDDKDIVKERMLLRLQEEIKPLKTRNWFLKHWTIAAAAAVVVMTTTFLLVNRQRKSTNTMAHQSTRKEIVLPGTNVATLTLSNGKKILLNGSNKGRLAIQGNTIITKNAAGQISYDAANSPATNNAQIVYNTITTPKGGQYQIILPDGSKVWLNAASSLTYPIVFKGRERHVDLQGEAYFEIFKNKKMPFTVTAENATIKVLGTHFNVMAYENEPSVNTTLLEGSIALKVKNTCLTMVPGQQTAANRLSNDVKIYAVDVEDAIAWKNGYFSFKKEELLTAMNKIARWYNVDVGFKGNISHKRLWGTVSRTANISELLDYLELTGIAKFQIDGRRVTVICK
jgi:transmembrane sensor